MARKRRTGPGLNTKTGVTIDDENKDEDDEEEYISTMDKVKEPETTHTAVAVAEGTMPVLAVAQSTNQETGIPIQFEDLQWKRSNDPKILDATRITVSLKDRGPTFLLESVLSYEESGIRQFSYPERLYLIMPWPRWFEFPVEDDDPYRDFTPSKCGRLEPHPLRFPVGNQARNEVMEYRHDPKKWFQMDYLASYTHWSAMYTTDYSDDHDFFAFYMAGGETSTMYKWFDESNADFDDSDIAVSKIVANIWKRVHPPSFLLFRKLKIAASSNPKENGYNTASYRRQYGIFASVAQTFSIMRKRVISFIVGDNQHFVTFMAVNFGAYFKSGSDTEKEPSFIANLDSISGGSSMNSFVYWLLSVIYEIEVWVTQFLNTPIGVFVTNPELAAIGRKCKTDAKSLSHRVCGIPIQHVQQIPRQQDQHNCGVFSVLNTRAGFLANVNHHVSWPRVTNIDRLWQLVLKPFWQLPANREQVQPRVNERVQKFRNSLVTLLLGQSFDNPVSKTQGTPVSKTRLAAETTAIHPLEVPSGSSSEGIKPPAEEKIEEEEESQEEKESRASNQKHGWRGISSV